MKPKSAVKHRKDAALAMRRFRALKKMGHHGAADIVLKSATVSLDAAEALGWTRFNEPLKG